MNDRARWSDAIQTAAWIRRRGRDHEILLLLSQLPLLPAQLIGRLTRHQSPASTYRCLTRLRGAGLVTTVRPAISRGHGPALNYLTNLGLATVGLLTGVEPAVLARQHRLRTADLAAMLAQLPHVLASYELLAFVVAVQPGPAELLRWERPFRRKFRKPSRVTPVTVEMPAYVDLRHCAQVASFLLYPDLGTVPLRAVRPALDRLAVYQSRPVGMMPTVVVVTSTQARVDAWERLLDEVAGRRGVKPVPARLLTWEELRDDHRIDVGARHDQRTRVQALVPLVHLETLEPRSRSGTPLLSFICDPLDPTPTVDRRSVQLGQMAIRLGPADFELVDLVSRHPFLALRQLASALAVEVPTVRRRRNRLIADGVLRLVRSDEIGNPERSDEWVEVTAAGLRLMAAHHGLSPSAAVRALGHAGGGPEHPFGQRTALIRQFEHTCGVNDVFVRFCKIARQLAATGSDDALVAWRNAAACARGRLRPDAYGVYRHHGRLSGFFLEYDRGTMSARDYAAKFAAYYAYRRSGQFERDYDGFPTILMLTSDDLAEERIAGAVQAAMVGRGVTLPLLLTCQWRVDDRRNPDGFLGRIWSQPTALVQERRSWFTCLAHKSELVPCSRTRV